MNLDTLKHQFIQIQKSFGSLSYLVDAEGEYPQLRSASYALCKNAEGFTLLCRAWADGFFSKPDGVLSLPYLDIAGIIEITAEGWLHITLNTLLPRSGRGNADYVTDIISRLLRQEKYPYFDTAFLGIVECCSHKTRTVFDNDNKEVRGIVNALKGYVFPDDSQFHLSLGLFSKMSSLTACHIYVLPQKDISRWAVAVLES